RGDIGALVMDVKVWHALVHRPDNRAAFAGLLSSMQGRLPGHDEPQDCHHHQHMSRLGVTEDTALTTIRAEHRHAPAPSMSQSLAPHIHLPPWHHTCSNLPKLNTVVPWIGGHCLTRFQYPMADFQ